MWKVVIPVVALVVGGGLLAGYLEFCLDIRMPQAQIRGEVHVVTPIDQLSTERYIEITKEMKEKYGPNTKTLIGPSGATTEVDGVVMERQDLPRTFRAVYGLTLIDPGKGTDAVSTFPYHLAPAHVPDSAEDGSLAAHIRDDYKNTLRARLLDFTDNDFRVAACKNFPASEMNLPIANRLFNFGSTTLCMVTWQREPQARMLVGVVHADGGLFGRAFARGACRRVAQAWLAMSADLTPPDYVQCILGDRPPRHDSISTVIYQRRADGQLALIE